LLLISAGSGLQVVLLGTRAPEAGFTNIATGIVMSGYFAGIFVGSIVVPHILARVGPCSRFWRYVCHRLFSSFGARGISLIHLFGPGMRFASGFSFAGMYIVCESWLNEKATNETRGQLLSLYMITNLGGMAAGQLMISFGQPGGSGLFLLASIVVSIAVVPILITAGKAPSFEAPDRISFRRLVQVSPLAVVGMVFVGVVVSMLFGMGAVYGRAIGLDNTQVGYFMASITLGTLALQYPIGRLSDRFDRRIVIFGAALVAGITISMAGFFGADQFISLFIFMLVFGGLLFSLYSLFIAHANDYLPPSQMVAMSSGLLMVNSAGAVLGSPLAATVIEIAGVKGFLPTIGAFLFLLAGFVIYRMSMRSAVPVEAQGVFVAIPDASTGVAVNLSPEVEWVMDQDKDEGENDPFKNNPYVS
jgi:MFS family permease